MSTPTLPLDLELALRQSVHDAGGTAANISLGDVALNPRDLVIEEQAPGQPGDFAPTEGGLVPGLAAVPPRHVMVQTPHGMFAIDLAPDGSETGRRLMTEAEIAAFRAEQVAEAKAAQESLGGVARDLCEQSGAVGCLIALLLPDGRTLVAALGDPASGAAECVREMNVAVAAIAKGETIVTAPPKPPCIPCRGAGKIDGLPCLGCGGTGLRS